MTQTQNPTRRNGSRFSLKRIWARNFKSIRELDLELGPLTVLVGPNASGKSNVLDVLHFIKQAFRGDLDSAIAARQGIGAVRRHSPKGGTRDVEVGVEFERDDFRMRYGFVLGSRSGVYRVKRERGQFAFSGDRQTQQVFEIRDGHMVKPKIEGEVQYETSELAFPSFARTWLFRSVDPPEPQSGEVQLYRAAARLPAFLRRSQFYRLFPDTMREPRRPAESHLLAEDGNNLTSVLRAMIKQKSPYLGEIRDSLAQVVPGMKDLRVQQSGGFLVIKLRHGADDNGGREASFDLTQESDGTVRLLGLLTAFYQPGRPSLIGVEEPELTIHPGALAVLADVMVEASQRTQVVATTHSPDLIDQLPVESLRAVEMLNGCTEVGPVSKTQTDAVLKGLFSAGELHSMEGLAPRR